MPLNIFLGLLWPFKGLRGLFKPFRPVNPICLSLLEHCPKSISRYQGLGFQFFLEMTCLGVNYHIKKMLDFKTFFSLERRLPRVPPIPYEFLVFQMNSIFFCDTRQLYGVKTLVQRPHICICTDIRNCVTRGAQCAPLPPPGK